MISNGIPWNIPCIIGIVYTRAVYGPSPYEDSKVTCNSSYKCFQIFGKQLQVICAKNKIKQIVEYRRTHGSPEFLYFTA